jgi:O-methyltransferase involved in polyketide biosynthesis
VKLNTDINQISRTAFLTLQCHALDATSRNPILNDQSSLNTLAHLKSAVKDSDSALYQRITDDKVKANLVKHTVLRARQYDRYIRDFLDLYPDATVVNIGCGLDDRFTRVDNGRVRMYDLDLPDIMALRSQLFPPKERYEQIAQSVFEFDWIGRISGNHAILVAEGVFMYCEESDVRDLFRHLQARLVHPEIVFEVFNKKWLRGWRRRSMEVKMTKELKLDKETLFRFGISDSDEIEQWDPGYRLLGDWSYFDNLEGSLLAKLARNIDSLRKVQWTVRYRL